MKNASESLLNWAWYSTRFIGEIEKAKISNEDITIAGIENRYLGQLKNEGVSIGEEFPLLNVGSMMMFAYAILVAPKEIMKKKGISCEDFSFGTKGRFNFIDPPKQDPDYFLRKIRNSVSHCHFDISSDENLIVFWDEFDGKENFRVTTTKEGFWAFLDEVGKYYSKKF